jgi:hypothetical protein
MTVSKKSGQNHSRKDVDFLSQKSKYRLFFILFLLIGVNPAYSTESYTKYWSVATIIGPMPTNSLFKYYFEPQLRLINDPYVFNQLLLLGGLGYQFHPTMIFFVGPGWILTRNSQGIMIHENRLWEQLNWQAVNTSYINVNSRTRLEERKNTDFASVAFRFRERVWVRIPIKNSEDYFFSCFDEIFLNINHPKWVSPYLFEQNRVFIGFGTTITRSTLIDIGYLNQYIHAETNKLNNVWLLNFSVNL